jgi:hypothetical protein
MESYVLSQEEQAKTGFTHRIRVTHEDLTQATANTAQTIAIHTVAARDYISDAAFNLVTPFEDASDNAFNTTTLIVGDDGNDDRYIASAELNVNGSEILAAGGVNSTVKYAYVAANTIDAIFGSMAAKSLSDIDVGEVDIFLKVSRLPDLA